MPDKTKRRKKGKTDKHILIFRRCYYWNSPKQHKGSLIFYEGTLSQKVVHLSHVLKKLCKDAQNKIICDLSNYS